MMITAHVDTDKRSLSPPWKKSIHPKSQDSSFRMETRDKKPYANHSAAQGKNAQDGTPTARNHSSSTVAMPSIIPTRRILTESAGDKDPIQLPLSLSKSKRKQALELIYRKRTHLKFPDSDEEQDGSTAKSFHTDDRRTNIPPDKASPTAS